MLAELLLGLLLTGLVVLPFALLIFWWRAHRKRKYTTAQILGASTLLTWALYASFFYGELPLGDKRIAEFTTKDGLQMVVHQTCNYSPEPYTTRFYYRDSPANRWHAFYMDHEDSRWWSGKIAYDAETKAAQIFRVRDKVATFSTRTLEFSRFGCSTTNDWVLDAGMNPGDEVKKF